MPLNRSCELGLKVWSSNACYHAPAKDLYQRGILDYVEVYAEPDTVDRTARSWRDLGIPLVVHAPHAYGGMNLSLPDHEQANRVLIEEVARFDTILGPEHVIVHPGIQGQWQETARQIQVFQKEQPELFSRVLVENKPAVGLKGEICVGASPEDMTLLLEATGRGLCLDMGHALCYAAYARRPYQEVIERFLTLRPAIIHLSDGEMGSVTDKHLNFGEGDFPLDWLISVIPVGVKVSVETHKASRQDLEDFERDARFFWRMRGYGAESEVGA